MDFERIKPAAEEIKLSEIQQERIISACENHKKKKFNYKLWISVAAAAMFAVVIFSPGFIFRAGSKEADMAAPESGNGIYNYYAYEENMCVVEDYLQDSVVSVQNQSATVESKALFDSGEYRKIYSVIPSQFIWLVDYEEYENWKKTVDAADGMAMLQFVEHFGITREDFDSANASYEAYINSTGESALRRKPESKDEEESEVFDAEIIYSFDKEKIDEYYLADYK